MSEAPAPWGDSQMAEPSDADEIDSSEVPEGQIAFDINDVPGGARGAIEAVLMVID